MVKEIFKSGYFIRIMRIYFKGEKMKRKILVIYLCTLLMIPLFASTAMANEPPTAPQIDGPTSGKAGEPLTYTFTSIDPDGDFISYFVRWDWSCCASENSDFVPSGEPVSMSHTYSRKGTYSIRVMAKDINQAESNWSVFKVTIPRTRSTTNIVWYQLFLDLFPNAFPLLRLLLEFL